MQLGTDFILNGFTYCRSTYRIALRRVVALDVSHSLLTLVSSVLNTEGWREDVMLFCRQNQTQHAS